MSCRGPPILIPPTPAHTSAAPGASPFPQPLRTTAFYQQSTGREQCLTQSEHSGDVEVKGWRQSGIPLPQGQANCSLSYVTCELRMVSTFLTCYLSRSNDRDHDVALYRKCLLFPHVTGGGTGDSDWPETAQLHHWRANLWLVGRPLDLVSEDLVPAMALQDPCQPPPQASTSPSR